jgi:hypothetical protein
MARPYTLLTDSFKILRDNLNTVSYNVGDPVNLLTHGDSDVVMAINEIERVFDASAGEILYPTGNSLQGETQTRLLLSTAQNSGTDITLNAGLDINLDAVGDINLDAGGANINFLDDSVARFNFTLGATNVLDVTGVLDLNISSNLDADIAGNSTLTTTGSQTQEGTSLNLDFSGDITLDADGNDIIFKNGAGNDTVTHTLANDATYKVTVPNNYTLDVDGDIILDADSDANIIFKDAGNTEYTFATDGTISRSASLQIDVTGDITLDADGNEILFKNGTGGDTVTHTLANNAQYTIATPADYVIDVTGDLKIDVDGDNIELAHAGTDRHVYTLGDTNTIVTTGNLTQTVAGSKSDSASGTYHIGATGNADITTMGTFETTSDSQTHGVTGNYDLNVSGNISDSANGTYHIGASGNADITTMGTFQTTSDSQTHNVTGDFTVDASGDINLDAGGDNIRLKDGGSTRQTYTLGSTTTIATPGALTQTSGARTYAVTGNQSDSASGTRDISATDGINIDTTGPMTLTATGAQNLVSGGNWKATVTGTATIDASTDIILDADDNDIILKHAGTQWGKLRDSGTNVTLYSGTTKAVSWTGANQRAHGNLHVLGNTDIDGTLNVDGATDLNGHVDLGNATSDNISIIGRVDTNIIPDADDTYNLGSGTLQWKHAFFDGTVTTDDLVADSADIGNFNIIANTISNSNAVSLTTGALTATVTGNALIDASGDITLDAGGDNIYLKDSGTTRQTYTLGDTTTIATTGNLTTTTATNRSDSAGGTYHIGSKGNMDLTSMGTLNLVSDNFTATVNGNALIDASGDITLDALGKDVILKDGANQRIKHTLGATNTTAVTGDYNTTASDRSDSASGTYHVGATGNYDIDTRGTFDIVSGGDLTATVTGDAVVDASGDITLDVDGDDIVFAQAGTTKITYNLGTNQEIDVAGSLTYDVAGDIILDANGGDVYLKDNGVQFGRFQNSGNHLDIYSGANLAVEIDAGKVEIHGRPLFTDSDLSTVAQDVAGGINELHAQLDSAVSQIDVNEGRITGNDTDIAELSTRVGALTSLDSATDGNFFTTSSINNDSIVNAINELARRTVLIYDENGTLLN